MKAGHMNDAMIAQPMGTKLLLRRKLEYLKLESKILQKVLILQ